MAATNPLYTIMSLPSQDYVTTKQQQKKNTQKKRNNIDRSCTIWSSLSLCVQRVLLRLGIFSRSYTYPRDASLAVAVIFLVFLHNDTQGCFSDFLYSTFSDTTDTNAKHTKHIQHYRATLGAVCPRYERINICSLGMDTKSLVLRL